MSRIIAVGMLIFLAACATKPPVQEMAAARSAIESAKSLPNGNHRASEQLMSAETALAEAAEAIEKKHYENARRKALEAKRKAQRAAKMKQYRK